jgi:oligo-1,6-glucosidase
LKNPDSVFHFYKKLIKLRKNNDLIVYGHYELIHEDHEQIFAYTRTLGSEKLLVICNFSNEMPVFTLPEGLKEKGKQLLISNYQVDESENIQLFTLSPYEARVYKLQ